MAMEKRYQVFVSSTYKDLQEERQEVMHALLELNCIPAGMELFPATSDDQWTLIRQVIDECDYYLVIIGGRYGSIGPTGIGYTEMEYRYAVEQGKPVIAFLHSKPEDILAKRTEPTEEGRKKLDNFRKLAKERMCKIWTTPADLGGVVSRSLIHLIKTKPAVGWVRADRISSQEAMSEILRLQRQVEEMKGEINKLRTEPPAGAEELAQGDDVFIINVTFSAQEDYAYRSESKTYSAAISLTWNRILWALGPSMIDEASQNHLHSLFLELVESEARAQLARRRRLRGLVLSDFSIPISDFTTVIVQLRALGLIRQSERRHSASSSSLKWTLTPYGDGVMTRLRAVRRNVNEDGG